MSSPADRWIALALGLGLACGCASDAADGEPTCDGVKCDDLDDDSDKVLAGPGVVECWIDEGDAADRFFQVDQIACRFILPEDSPVSLFGASVSVRGEDDSVHHGDALLRAQDVEPVHVASVQPEDYPLQITVDLSYESGGAENRLLRDLTRTTDRRIVAEAGEMTSDVPFVSRMPFDFWGITLYGRDDVSVLRFDHEIPAGDGVTHRVSVDARPLLFGQRATHWVPVPPEVASIPVLLGDGSAAGESFELAGAGDYVARDGVLSRATESDLPLRAEGSAVAACDAEERGGELRVHCSSIDVAGAGLRTQLVVRTANGMETATDLGDTEELVATLTPAMLPAQFEAQTVIEGKVAGLPPALREAPYRSFEVLASAREMRFHLGFEIWSVGIASEVDTFGGDVKDFVLELGGGYDSAFASKVEGIRLPSLSMGEEAELLFAAPVDMEEMPGSAFAVLGVDVAEDVEVLLRPGRFRATMSGLVPQ